VHPGHPSLRISYCSRLKYYLQRFDGSTEGCARTPRAYYRLTRNQQYLLESPFTQSFVMALARPYILGGTVEARLWHF